MREEKRDRERGVKRKTKKSEEEEGVRRVCFAEIVGWEVADKVRMCCIGRDWREAY